MLCRISTETLGVDIRKADGVTGEHMMSGWTGLDLFPPTTNPWPKEVPDEKTSFHHGTISGALPMQPYPGADGLGTALPSCQPRCCEGS